MDQFLIREPARFFKWVLVWIALDSIHGVDGMGRLLPERCGGYFLDQAEAT